MAATTPADTEIEDDYDPLDAFETYQDYLDRQVTEVDLYYLEDADLARQLVELGYRGSIEVMPREEFLAKKAELERVRAERRDKKPKPLASANKDATIIGHPLLEALAAREREVLSGNLGCIIFIRDYNAQGQEVSGYIDFAHRLRTENMEAVFEGKRRLVPKPTDLSYYNWFTKTSAANPTADFQILADDELGLLFKNKHDRKIINVDPWADPGEHATRTEVETGEYVQVVIFDHYEVKDAGQGGESRPISSQSAKGGAGWAAAPAAAAAAAPPAAPAAAEPAPASSAE